MILITIKVTPKQFHEFAMGIGYLFSLTREYLTPEEARERYDLWQHYKDEEDEDLSFEDWIKQEHFINYWELRTRAWDYVKVSDDLILIAYL
jgi:hypothetical protein